MTYNILSDIYAYPTKHYGCPEPALWWTYRGKNLLDEIIGYRSQIIGLLEVINPIISTTLVLYVLTVMKSNVYPGFLCMYKAG